MKNKKVLVIGSGGREHAIVDALHRSEQVEKIYAAPGNAGMVDIAENVSISVTELEKLRDFAVSKKIDLTVVGPEIPLSAGIVDVFNEAGLKVFGPTKAAAQIEASKKFAKDLMKDFHIPTAAYEVFEDYEEALAYVEAGSFPTVLKYDGLAAGKGVVIPENLDEAKEALADMLLDHRFGKGKVVVEEFLSGPEFSYMCFVKGEEVYPLVVSQDHKRAYEGDKGPNTGGMGAYSPVPLITKEDEEYALEHVMKPTAAAMVELGCPFNGILYGGLMKTPNGIKVIEFNCRFGDPETEVALPRLESDIYDIFSYIADNNLAKSSTVVPDAVSEMKWKDDYVLGCVLASKGYPGSYEKGHEIQFDEHVLSDKEIKYYHMGTKLEGEKLLTNGGRVLMAVGMGKTLQDAQKKAYEAVKAVKCDNLFYRSDIGWRAL